MATTTNPAEIIAALRRVLLLILALDALPTESLSPRFIVRLHPDARRELLAALALTN